MLTDAEKLALTDAIVEHGTLAEFETMVKDTVNTSPATFTSSTDVRDVVRATIDNADEKEWLRKLLATLLFFFKARHPAGRVAAEILYTRWGTAGLQTLVDGSDMFEWAFNAECMQAISSQVCMVQVRGRGIGTGVLVGEDCVLTSYHVIEPLMNGGDQAPDTARHLSCKFDYSTVKEASGRFVARNGVTVDAADRWLLSFSEQTRVEREQQTCPPYDAQISEFDYALIALKEKVGRQRGWVHLKKPGSKLQRFEKVRIAQHPQDQPLKGADGRLTTIPPHGARIQYSASTSKASSGSPCWNEDFDLVALHNLGGLPMPSGVENQGIPIDCIVDDIKAKRGDTPPPPPVPQAAPRSVPRLWTLGADYPVLGRAQFQDRLVEMLDLDGGQLLLVRGENPGRTFSIEIAQRILGRLGHIVVDRSAVALTSTSPEQLVEELRSVLKLGPLETRMGADASTRASAVDRHLAEPFLIALGQEYPIDPEKPTFVWLLFDALDQAKLTDETHDFLLSVLAKMSPYQMLRVVLVGYNRELPGSIARVMLEDETPVIVESDVAEHIQHTCDVVAYPIPAARIQALAADVVAKGDREAERKVRGMAEGTPEEAMAKARARAKARLDHIGLVVQKLTRNVKARKPPEVEQ